MDTKTLIYESVQALNDRDFEKFASEHDPNGDFRQPGVEGGLDNQINGLKALTSGIPDGRFKIDSLVVEGDRAAGEGVLEGTHTATLRMPGAPEIPATGRRVTLHQAVHFEVRNGKFTKAHAYVDRMELMEQLGMMPQAPAAAKG